uniref:Uncharacterized protein n=1 Tax=Haptolina ericina TaxID=156174 RepID=A0A7S3AQP3_9EUKA
MSEQDQAAAQQQRLLRAMAEGESAIPHLFTVLAEDASVAGEPDVKKGLKIGQRIKKGVKSLANPKDLLRNRLYIVFLCDYSLEPISLSDGSLGYEISEPTEWVKKYGPLLKGGLFLCRTALFVAKFAGSPISLPSELVEGVEALLSLKESVGELGVQVADEIGVEVPALDELSPLVLDPPPLVLSDSVKETASKVLSPERVRKQVHGRAFRELAQSVLQKDPDLTRLPMRRVVSADGVVGWVSEANAAAWEACNAAKPFDSSRWAKAAELAVLGQAGSQEPVASSDVTLVMERGASMSSGHVGQVISAELGAGDPLTTALKRAEEAEARAKDLEKQLAASEKRAAEAGGCCVLS